MVLTLVLVKRTKFERLSTRTWYSGETFVCISLHHESVILYLTVASLLICSSWQKGDIMCIDNFSVSHGRQPTYDLGRKILVAWSTPINKRSLQLPYIEEEDIAEEVGLTKESEDAMIFDDKLVPGAVIATPDCTPVSTLTRAESEDLRDSFALSMEKIARNDSFLNVSARGSVGGCHKRNKSCPVQHMDELFA